MSFGREITNTVATLGGAQVASTAVRMVGGNESFAGVAGILGGYAGNLLYAGKSPEELKEIIRERAVFRLLNAGYTQDAATQAFEENFENVEIKSNVWRNIGNQLMTSFGAGIGGGFTALATLGGSKITDLASGSMKEADLRKAIGTSAIPIIIGGVVGGFLGNKAWNKPAEKDINEATGQVVARILAQKKNTNLQQKSEKFVDQISTQEQQTPERQI